MPYRTAQTIALFVGFMAAVLTEYIFAKKSKCFKIVFITGMLWLAMRQSVYLNQVLALNNQRSENEISVVHQIGTRLKSEFDEKTVVFVGSYDFGEYITSQIELDEKSITGRFYSRIRRIFEPSFKKQKIFETNVNSLLDFSERCLNSQRFMKEYFSYCGYDIQVLESYPKELQENYNKIAKKEGIRPFEIRDMDDYIMVCIGELE